MSLVNMNNRNRNNNSSFTLLPNINNHTTLLKSKINIKKNEKLLYDNKISKESSNNSIYSSSFLKTSSNEKKEIKKLFSSIQMAICDNKFQTTSNILTNNRKSTILSLPSPSLSSPRSLLSSPPPSLSSPPPSLLTNIKKHETCDKCDGKHQSDHCPHYKKERDNHPDAQKNFYEKIGGISNLPHGLIKNATIIRQPGDGTCLFHSMSYGIGEKNGSSLRSQICQFISTNGDIKICGTPLSEWVKWDSNTSTANYARKMQSAWGGGIEMACMSIIKKCNVHVYERKSSSYKRISAFDFPDSPETKKTVRVLYQGSCHYDALVI